MKKLAISIKDFFSKKDKGEEVGKAPVGMCPTCWGHSEWEGHYYKVIKDKHIQPGGAVYDSFISKVVDKHVKSTHRHENKYICTTCSKEISN